MNAHSGCAGVIFYAISQLWKPHIQQRVGSSLAVVVGPLADLESHMPVESQRLGVLLVDGQLTDGANMSSLYELAIWMRRLFALTTMHCLRKACHVWNRKRTTCTPMCLSFFWQSL